MSTETGIDPDRFTPPRVDPAAFERGVLDGVCRVRSARRARNRGLACLAVFLLGAGLWLRATAPPDPRETAHTDPLPPGASWLLARQDPGGAWQAEAWGGHERFSPGVSALATLALLETLPPGHQAPLEQAAKHLLSTLDPHAPLRMEGPELYNHLLGMKALLAVEAQSHDPEREAVLRKAVHTLLRQQHPDGGWGYAADAPLGYIRNRTVRTNSAVTWWVCDLLRDGLFLSVPGTERALARGESWLNTCFADPNTPRYHPDSLPAASNGALYWMARTHRGTAADVAAMPSPRPDAYRDMIRSRVDRNTPAPAPNPEDRWWRAGGQIYATAASLLAANGN